MGQYPLALQYPGPKEAVWPERNSMLGVVCHSAEGDADSMYARLQSGQVSWHFSVLKDGVVEQHYDPTASCWHAGSHYQNNRLIGVEHEGMAGEPLTTPQLAASISLVHWLATDCGFPLVRNGGYSGLVEHKEIYPTACPSGRIPWEKYTEDQDLQEGRRLTQPEAFAFLAQFGTAEGAIVFNGLISEVENDQKAYIVRLP